MRQPYPKSKPVPLAGAVQRALIESMPAGAELAAQALTDFQSGNYRDGFRNSHMAFLDSLTHGAIPNRIDWEHHPQGLEALAPGWGPMRDGIADLDDGNLGGALINAGLTAADTFGGKAVLGAAGAERAVSGRLAQAARNNRGAPARDPRNWRRVRKAMGDVKVGFLKPGQPGHHWLIPRNGWGKTVPNALKNRPWNIMPMADEPAHNAIHRLKSPIEQYLRGTPTGWKALNAEAALRSVDSADVPNDE
jgi:hypothetical protein